MQILPKGSGHRRAARRQPSRTTTALGLIWWSILAYITHSIRLGFNGAGTFAAIGSNKMSPPLMMPERGCASFSQQTRAGRPQRSRPAPEEGLFRHASRATIGPSPRRAASARIRWRVAMLGPVDDLRGGRLSYRRLLGIPDLPPYCWRPVWRALPNECLC
jgi:hypothetical protein